MGRGRQKAKHTKVARDLKYYSPDTNYGALANELHTTGPVSVDAHSVDAHSVDAHSVDLRSPELDKWAEYLDEDASEDADESRTA
jgi:hypothetical protein